MTKREKAKIVLNVLDLHAPANINKNLESNWIDAIMRGLTVIEKEEAKELEAGCT